MPDDLETNRQNAIAVYRAAGAAEAQVGAQYIQRYPAGGDGAQAFIDYFAEMTRGYPGKRIEFVRAVAGDDRVALHTHQTWAGGTA